MYCGAPLGAADAPLDDDVLAKKRDRARELLRTLRPEARAMMPPDVIVVLERDAAWTPGATPLPASPAPAMARASSAAPAPARTPSQAGSEGLSTAAPPPSPAAPSPGARSFLLGGNLLSARKDEAPAPRPMLAPMSSAAMPRIGAPPSDDALRSLLSHGTGPFGPRHARYRLLLQPHVAYRERLPWLRARLSAATHLDAYTAAAHLQRDIPVCVGAGDELGPLHEVCQHLRAGGLRMALIDRDRWLDERLPIGIVAMLALDADLARLRTDGGDTIDVRRTDLRAGAIGEIDRSADAALEIKKNRLGLAQVPARAGLADRFTPFIALDLLRTSSPRPLRIRSARFDFSCLGERKTIAAARNVHLLAELLLPPDSLDDRFKRVPAFAAAGVGAPALDVTVARREADFTEYVLLRDDGARAPG